MLEARRLLASAIKVNDVLTVTGNETADVIAINAGADNQEISVTINGGAAQVFQQINYIIVSAGGGNDKVTVAGAIDRWTTLRGGSGNDSLVGGGGNDWLDGGSGADTMKGGGGSDTADYSARTASLTIGLGTVNDDGETGEKDNVWNDIETVLGGLGNDFIRGSAVANLLIGNGGKDTLLGGTGDDTLVGGTGAADSMNGEAGTDFAYNDGTDTVVSAEGNLYRGDALIAPDRTLVVTGSSGVDLILLHTSPPEQVGITVNGITFSFFPGAFDRVVVNALGGADSIKPQRLGDAANAKPITINGGDGNDIVEIDGGSANPITIFGNAGNDFVFRDNAIGFFDTVPQLKLYDGGSGSDTLEYNSFNEFTEFDMNQTTPNVENMTLVQGLLVGNGLNNVLELLGQGTLMGGGGNDVLKGGGDSLNGSLLDGGAGNDTLQGQSFNGGATDTLRGGSGNDSLVGGEGSDVLDGGTGGDTMKGGGGNDTADYSARTAPLTIGPGTLPDDGEAGEHDNVAPDIETILGGSAGDHIKGHSTANNLLIGNGGNDTLLGLAGDDTLQGNAGADRLDGGDGFDTATNDGSDTLISIESGGSGTGGTIVLSDRVVIVTGTALADSVGVEVARDEGSGEEFGIQINLNGSVFEQFAWSDFDSVVINTLGDRDSIGINNPQLTDQTITVNLGDDDDDIELIDVFQTVTVNGGAGNDTLDADESAWVFHGGSGVDSVTDYHFDQYFIDLRTMPTTENASMKLGDIWGNDLDNILHVDASGGLSGLGGNDHISTGGDPDYGPSGLSGGDGNDTLIAGGTDDGLSGGNGNDSLEGGDGNDELLGGAGNDTIGGGSGDDILFGDDGADILDGDSGDDSLDGGTGADTIQGGSDNDTLDYSSRSAPLTIGPGTKSDDGEAGEGDNIATDIETILGGSGNDHIKGTAANNLLVGNDGNDTLLGFEGDDTLDGGAGADSLDGGEGSDTAANDGSDTLISIENSSAGIRAYLENRVLIVDGTADDDVINVTGNVGGGDFFQVTGGSGTIGTSEFDTILVRGFGGADVIAFFYTGSKPATLNGGDGDDFFHLFNSSASLIGGDGNDEFYWDTDGVLTGFDGGPGTDLLRCEDAPGPVDLRLYPSVESATLVSGLLIGNDLNNRLEIVGFGNSTIIGGGGNDTLIGSAADDVLDGQGGADLMTGGDGNDSLEGGAGNDTLDGQFGADTMKGGEGNDTADYSSRGSDLTIGLGTLSDDGEAGEGDNVWLDIETVLGGSGNDHIKGAAANNLLVGNGGNDTLFGNYGNDTLLGGEGNDDLDGGPDADTLDGGSGTDRGKISAADVLISIEQPYS